MLQRTLNRTAYYTSLVISFVVFLTIWLNLIVLEVSHFRRPDTVAVSSIVGAAGEKMPNGKIVSLTELDKLSGKTLPAWPSIDGEDGSKIWSALIYFQSKSREGIQIATVLKGVPTYGVVEGKFQFLPVLIKKEADKKTLQFALPSGPIEIVTGAGVSMIDEKKSTLIKSLIDQRENRRYFRQMIGAAPVRERISGQFLDAYSHSAPHTPCVLPLCYVYKPSSYKDFYGLSLDGHTFDLELTFDGDGSFESANYKKEN